MEPTLTFVVPAVNLSLADESANTTNGRRLLKEVSLSQLVTFTITPCANLCEVQPGSGGLMYSMSDCKLGEIEGDPSAMKYADRCKPCPAGGYCPGGGVVWPTKGYWSASEMSMPLQCKFAEACPGVQLDEGNASAIAFFIKTDRCAVGFAGDYCSKCATPGYYRDGYNCRSCEAAAVSGSSLAVTVVTFFFTFLGLLLVGLPANWLAQVVTTCLGIQKLSIALKAATPHVDKPEWLVKMLEVFGMLLGAFNLELSIFKPGCAFSSVSFFAELYGTLSFAVFVTLAYILLCTFRSALIRPVRRCFAR
jgi:hypothetical protein